jgi:hypothetical protein
MVIRIMALGPDRGAARTAENQRLSGERKKIGAFGTPHASVFSRQDEAREG